jgi:SAM-dependent methyltransferase
MDSTGGYIESGFVVDFYDSIYHQRRDIPFFLDWARYSRGPVLELGCGTGRILIPIAKAGLQIVGIDQSSLMLSVCQKKLLNETEMVRSNVDDLVCRDMRQFSLGRKFNLITIPFYTFNYILTIEDQLSCLSNIYQHLNKGGRLILDLPNPYLPYLIEDNYYTEFGEEPEFILDDGRVGTRRYCITSRDLSNQIIYSDVVYYVSHPDGLQDRLVNHLSIRYLFRYEAEHLLLRCGFSVEEVFADYDKSAFGSKYPGELIFIARKK